MPPRSLRDWLFRRLPLLAALSAVCTGCPKGSALEGSDAFNKACDARPIFRENCAGSTCHGDEKGTSTPKGGIDLFSGGLEARLVGRAASYAEIDPEELPSCQPESPELLVDPRSPENSLLLTKLNGNHRCGDDMPLGAPLDDSAIRCVRSFVLSLAESGTPAGNGGAPQSAGGQSGTGLGGAK